MHIEKIAEQIADKIQGDNTIWDEVLSNTNPGNYGCEDWDVEINPKDIWVDIPKGTFSINRGHFKSTIILGGSSDGVNTSYNKPFKGNGKFVFEDDSNIKTENVNISIDNAVF